MKQVNTRKTRKKTGKPSPRPRKNRGINKGVLVDSALRQLGVRPRAFEVKKTTAPGASLKIFTEGSLRSLLKDLPEALQKLKLDSEVTRRPIEAAEINSVYSGATRDLGSSCEGLGPALALPIPHTCGDGKIILSDAVNHPQHYNSHPSGIECIEIARHMNFNLGNVFKYIWRTDHKEADIQDLEKAEFYLRDEIATRKRAVAQGLESGVSPKPQYF